MTIGTEVGLIVPMDVSESDMNLGLVGFPSNTMLVNLPKIENNSLVGGACDFHFYFFFFFLATPIVYHNHDDDARG